MLHNVGRRWCGTDYALHDYAGKRRNAASVRITELTDPWSGTFRLGHRLGPAYPI